MQAIYNFVFRYAVNLPAANKIRCLALLICLLLVGFAPPVRSQSAFSGGEARNNHDSGLLGGDFQPDIFLSQSPSIFKSSFVVTFKFWDGGGATNNWSEAANWTDDTLPGADDVVFFNGSVSSKSAVIDINANIQGLSIETGYTGTVSLGAGINIVIGGGYNFCRGFCQVAGTFNGNSGNIDLNGSFILSGTGIFIPPTGTMTIDGSFTYNDAPMAQFNPTPSAAGGTIVFDGNTIFNANAANGSLNVTVNFNNVRFDTTGTFTFDNNGSGADTMNVVGALTLTNGAINEIIGAIQANGAVTIENTFDGGSTRLFIAGNAARTVTLPANVPMLALNMNAPNGVLNTSGTGTLTFPTSLGSVPGLELSLGTIETGAVNFTTNGTIRQTGGAFNIQSGANLVCNLFSQSGGTFNGTNAGMMDVNALSVTGNAVFNAPSSSIFDGGSLTVEKTTGAQFNAGSGTIVFDGASGLIIVNAATSAQIVFFNLTVNLTSDAGALTFDATNGFDEAIIEGDLNLLNGQVGNSKIFIRGNTTVGSNFDGGATHLTFDNVGAQTFTNNGGVNPNGLWTVNKDGALNLLSNLDLSNGSSTLSLTNGIVNTGAFTLNAGTRSISRASGYVNGNLQRSFATTGTKTFDVGTANGYSPVSANVTTLAANPSSLIVSATQSAHPTLNGAVSLQRYWTLIENGNLTANLTFNYLDPADISGSETDYRAAKIDADVNFSTNAQVPIDRVNNRFTVNNVTDFAAWTLGIPQMTISPVNASVPVQSAQTFTASGGIAPFTYSISTNNSGGSINPSNGNYIAGTLAGAQDTIRATDAEGRTASAIVSVTPGAPHHLGFNVQPSNTIAGTSITPAVKVAIQDQFNNTVTTANDSVTVAIGNNPASGTLNGTLTQPAFNGIATFFGLSINNFADGYTLTANSGALLPSTSNAFNILSPFVVFNLNNSGAGSLRQAITNANNTPGTQTISFNIAGSAPFTIAPLTNLPIITEPVIIDGTTQPSYAGNPIIELSGANVPSSGRGLFIIAGNSTVKGLIVNRWNQYGIDLETNGGNVIQGNYIGTNAAVTQAQPNSTGVFMMSSGNQIGGPTVAARNVISGNTSAGVINNAGAGNTIRGNYIGTNAAGNAAIPNGTGVVILGSSVIVGGSAPGEGNVISGNTGDGIAINYNGQGHQIRGNFIGTNAAGTSALPNLRGIEIGREGSFASNIVIGGSVAGEGNLVAFNAAEGVLIKNSATRIAVRGNSIHSNGGQGIDLQPANVNANDACDADTGINNQQNYPVLTSLVSASGSTTISGTLNSAPNQTFTLDFYSNAVGDPNGFGEGKTYLGSTNVATDASCNASVFNFNLPFELTTEQVITATATDANGNTSEFSRALSLISISGTVRSPNTAGVPFATVSLRNNPPNSSVIRTAITDSTGRFTFSGLSPNLNYQVDLQKTNWTITPASRSYSNLTASVDDNYTGDLTRYTIGGGVFVTLGVTLSDATVTLNGLTNATTTTDSNGYFSFSNLLPGAYQVAVSKPDWFFSPPSQFVTITSNNVGLSFGALYIPPPAQGRIVFKIGNQLKAMNGDGSGIVTLRTDGNPSSYLISSPNISLDGSKIIYADPLDAFRAMNFDASNDGVLPNFTGMVGYPMNIVWSPDKSKIAYSRLNSSGDDKIFVMNADGSNLAQLSPNTLGVRDKAPSFSPDGSKIVFSRKDGANPEHLFQINVNGTNLIQITTGSSNDILPAWSPDGSKIAFARKIPPTNYSLMTSDANGGTQTIVALNLSQIVYLKWSPDGVRLVFTRTDPSILNPMFTVLANGSGSPTLMPSGIYPSWGDDNSLTTPAGSGINVQSGAVSISFVNSNTGGETTITPISPASAGTTPGGFVLGNVAYDISTTANFTPPVLVCFSVPASAYPTQSVFNTLSLLHNENGVLVDRTSVRDFPNRKVCGFVSSFSPFVIAQQIDQTMPSVKGLLIDQNGQPLRDFPVALSGDASLETTTDADGFFSFVNLTQGGNYTITPNTFGYVFDFPSQSYIGITGENTFVFTAVPAAFSIGGTVRSGDGQPLAGVTVNLTGALEAETTTDADGNYAFSGLPANGSFTVTPNGANLSPNQFAVNALQNNLSGVDFTQIAPTAAHSSISGRVVTADGMGLRNIVVTVTGGNLPAPRTIRTNSFGFYHCDGLEVGATYIVSVASRRYVFTQPSLMVNLLDEVRNADFIGSAP